VIGSKYKNKSDSKIEVNQESEQEVKPKEQKWKKVSLQKKIVPRKIEIKIGKIEISMDEGIEEETLRKICKILVNL